MSDFVFDSSKCKKCGGDGKKAVPVKNLNGSWLLVDRGTRLVIPDFFVIMEKCECQEKE